MFKDKTSSLNSGNTSAQSATAFPILTEPELHRVLHEWNDTRAAFPNVCVHELFEQQVARDPDAVAVVFKDQQLSYRELNQRANQAAHFLRKHGVGPEILVGVCFERSPEMVIALLGVWKAGGAYIPLDPAYPLERLSFMVSDAEIKVLLTDEKCKNLFPSARDKAICLDSDWPVIAEESTGNPAALAIPSNLAYVMYTSGSTGQPKGAMILHSGLVNYLWWAIRTYGVEAGSSVPVHSSISFDLTVTSLYPALLAGGQVELLPEDLGAQGLVTALRQVKNRSLVKITPAHLELLSRQLSPDETAGMTKTFVIGGENLLAESLSHWRDFAPGTRLINEYGPTETVVGCCVYEVQATDPRNGSVAIGKPIANTQLYVLDTDLQPVPPGVTGELYIGGAGVARGYLNRPELTQEKFIVDIFSGQSGSRLYKTGDLARYRKDGTLECLGRVDDQVKIRGYRIELGEIEATLAAHPGVQSCVVLAREDTPGNKQLVSYVIARNNELPDTKGLQDFLKQTLPEYMAPAYFVFLNSFPLTQNGKIDRKALPAPSYDNASNTQEFLPPRTETEKKLGAIWMDVLKVERIGIHDDFFDLGGHSLLVIKVLSQIRDVFEIDLPMQVFFENATIAALAETNILKERIDSGESVQRIERRTQIGPSPASPTQEGLWFLNQVAPVSPVYNIVDVISFGGEYNTEAMKLAVNELARRHEVLRTCFPKSDGRLVQVIAPKIDLVLSELHLSSLSEQERERIWTRVVNDEGRKPFDLSQAPLLRGTIVHLTPQKHELLLTIHHIIADEWSMEVIHQELSQLYKAFSKGQRSPLPDLPIQYADYVCWHRSWLQGEVRQKQISYWENELAGMPARLELPNSKPRPAVQTFHGETETFRLSKKLLERLMSLGRQEQATLFMTLLAGFMALLHRCTGQDDIPVGSPMSGRTRTETEGLIGCFLNTVVLRSRFTEQMNFRSLLHQVRERAMGAFAHQDISFEELVAHLAPERHPGFAPFFQVMFILHNRDGVSQVSKVSGNKSLGTGTSKFDLTLVISEAEDGLEGLIEYSTDLFMADTIRLFCGHYGTLLEAIVSDPDERISALPLLTGHERKQLLFDWNKTGVEFAGPETLHELIGCQAEITPEAVAVEFAGRSLSYRELDRRSNQVARHLKGLGVGPDMLVGLFHERSLDMLVGLLGILKAGGAYVPLDPSFPEDRLSYMVENSGMRVLLTHSALDGKLPTRPGSVVRLDADWKQIAKRSGDRLTDSEVSPKNLAYVLYTSGSTGKPKGVEIEHCAIVNFLLSMQREPGFIAKDTLLAVTTLSFDIAALELYLPLISGGRVVIASKEDTHDPMRLMQRMAESRCSVMQATPATWRALIDAGWSGSPKLKILCGGESFPPDLAEKLLARCRELWNMYGPTETTVWSTIWKVTKASGAIPIGRPIANTDLYVLDGKRNLVPVGVVGELYIGGRGVAREYLQREELTKERFVPSPFASDQRLYRTGDLARWLPDGTVECLGRVDNQVKIRGFRIELGEIEAVLSRHQAVRQCVVVAREDTPGEKALVAYYETTGAAQPAVNDLRAYLKKDLPDYMVPSAFVAMEKLPLTPNGKIDRKALPAPEGQGAAAPGEFLGPRDSLEQSLANIWSKVLKVKQVGRRDNFFDLGGHSLNAVVLISEVQKLTDKALPLATLFQAATVEAFADILRRDGWTPSWSSLVPIQPLGSMNPLYLVHGAEGNVLLYRQMTRHLGLDQPVYGLQSQGLNGDGRLKTTIPDMASAYVREILAVQPEGPYFLGGYCLGGVIAFEMAQQMTALGKKVELVVMLDTYNLSTVSRGTIKLRAPLHIMQNLWFHVANWISLSGEYRQKFLKEKAGIALTRLGIRVRAVYHAIQRLGKQEAQGSFPHLIIKKTNDEAAVRYAPQPYSGHVALIRPRSSFLGLSNPDYGWGSFVHEGLEIHQLTMYPKGMLIEPFCHELADTIKMCLQK